MVKAQNNPDYFSKELSFTTENDAYLFQKKDAYYTNGVFFALSKASEKNGRKRVTSYELGQMIFTPVSRANTTPSNIDRPFCGYLFIKVSQTQFQKNDAVVKYKASVGEVGQASLGEGLQNSYHRLFHYMRFTGWQYQVQNAIGLDMGISYAQTVLEDSSWIKFVPQAQANLGTTFTNASLGIYTCLGSFEKNSNSALWNARVQTREGESRRNFELFLYWYPQVILQGYNATVEGGLLNKGTGAVLAESERWMFQQSIGLCYAKGRWTTRASWVYQSKEAVTQLRSQQYGSALVSYRLH